MEYFEGPYGPEPAEADVVPAWADDDMFWINQREADDYRNEGFDFPNADDDELYADECDSCNGCGSTHEED